MSAAENSKHFVSKRAFMIWQRFMDWYGVDFVTKNFGERPPKEWCELIDQEIRTRTQLDAVLAAVRQQFPSWAPRFPQFEHVVHDILSTREVAEGPCIQERLISHVLRRKSLSNMQRCMPWKFIGKRFESTDLAGKIRRNHGVEIIGVEVPADGDRPGYRVMVEDLAFDQ